MDGVLIGVVSRLGSENCAKDKVFDIYTGVAHYMDWIYESVIRMGGMHTCDDDRMFEKTYLNGEFTCTSHFDIPQKRNLHKTLQECKTNLISQFQSIFMVMVNEF